MRERRTPDGAKLAILGTPPARPVLQIESSDGKQTRCVLIDADRAWLNRELADFETVDRRCMCGHSEADHNARLSEEAPRGCNRRECPCTSFALAGVVSRNEPKPTDKELNEITADTIQRNAQSNATELDQVRADIARVQETVHVLTDLCHLSISIPSSALVPLIDEWHAQCSKLFALLLREHELTAGEGNHG
jgi:hypothetical protein